MFGVCMNELEIWWVGVCVFFFFVWDYFIPPHTRTQKSFALWL